MNSSIRQIMQRFIDAYAVQFRFRCAASFRDIRVVESLLEVDLPGDLLELLSTANGQLKADERGARSDMFFPELQLPEHSPAQFSHYGYLCSIEEILMETLALREEYSRFEEDGQVWPDLVASFESIGPATINKSIIVLSSGSNPTLLGLDLQPAPGGTIGQVISISEQPRTVTVLAPSLSEYLERIWQGYESSKYRRLDAVGEPFWSER